MRREQEALFSVSYGDGHFSFHHEALSSPPGHRSQTRREDCKTKETKGTIPMKIGSNMNLTPKETVHAFCHICVQSRSDDAVEDCGGQLVLATGKPCPFYPYRTGKRVSAKVLRQQCMECMNGNPIYVRKCETVDCLLHLYRMGRNPRNKGQCAERMSILRRSGTPFSSGATAQNQFSQEEVIETTHG